MSDTNDTIEIEATPIDEATSGATSLTAVERAAIDSQVATAKQYPRSVDKSIKDALTLATMDEDTAASCFYALPRSGKTIEGPSARLAEIMAYSWGNFRADAEISHEDRTHIVAVGTAFDVEKNVAIRVRVRRRITDRDGKRYNEDMISVTANAAISIALRNAVFKVIPRSIVDRVYIAARRASLGKGGTITQKRQKAMEWFAKLGKNEAQVCEVLGVRGVDDIGEDQLITLRGMVTAIQDGEANVETLFRKGDAASDEADELNVALAGDDKTAETCKARFNAGSFDGAPNIPPEPAAPPDDAPEPSTDDRAAIDRAVGDKAKDDEWLDRECRWAFGSSYADLDDKTAAEVLEHLTSGVRLANVGLRTRADVAREIARLCVKADVPHDALIELAAEAGVAYTGGELTKQKSDVLAALLDAVRAQADMVG